MANQPCTGISTRNVLLCIISMTNLLYDKDMFDISLDRPTTMTFILRRFWISQNRNFSSVHESFFYQTSQIKVYCNIKRLPLFSCCLSSIVNYPMEFQEKWILCIIYGNATRRLYRWANSEKAIVKNQNFWNWLALRAWISRALPNPSLKKKGVVVVILNENSIHKISIPNSIRWASKVDQNY